MAQIPIFSERARDSVAVAQVFHGMTITVRHGHLELAPAGSCLTVSFQRTLRIPDDGRTYPLPPGLGEFPLRHVRDYAGRVPEAWLRRGGLLLPMYQREAMWLSFGGAPHALQVGIGKVCAVSGERWRESLCGDPQNYVVTGTQPWLDGIASGHGTIRQFVAMPLGRGVTVEAQLTGSEAHGGVQLRAFAPKPGRLRQVDDCSFEHLEQGTGAMGLAAGGTMAQKVYADPYGVDAWDPRASARVFVHIVNSERWTQITGEPPPPSPVSARSYIDAGLPWFGLYDEHVPSIAPTAKLAGVRSLAARRVDDGEW